MPKAKKTTPHRTAHIRDYLRYKFPLLRAFTGRAKWPLIAGMATLLCCTLYYAIRVPNPTPNGVLDGLVATPLQAAIITALIAVVAWARVYFYRGAKGSAERNIVGHASSVSSYLWLPLHSESTDFAIDCRDIAELKELHPFIESAVQFTDFDKEDNFRLEAGTLNVPKCTLRSLQIHGERVTLFAGSTSFYSVYYSHYFADYRLSRDSTDENTNRRAASLRSIFGTCAEDFLRSQIATAGERNQGASIEIRPYPILPNPLGLTGICFFRTSTGERVYIARHRGANVINETRRLDWSFSGLVEAHQFITPSAARIGLKEFVGMEMTDELLNPIFAHARRKWQVGEELVIEPILYYVLGLVFNGKYLFQPELVALVELGVSSCGVDTIHDYACETNEIKLFAECELLAQERFGPTKDLFLPIKARLVEYLLSSR
jgi:hypothetical protein